MLVLSRKPDETIVIGDNIVVTVVSIDGSGRVRLGVQAPGSIPVHRKEVYDRILADRARSSVVTTGQPDQSGEAAAA